MVADPLISASGSSFVPQLLPCPSSLGNEQEFYPLALFFLFPLWSFCACLPLPSAAPDVEGSGRSEIKKKPLQLARVERARQPHSFLACGQGSAGGCLRRGGGGALHSAAPCNRSSCSPGQSWACTAIQASVSLRELGLAHPSSQQGFTSLQAVGTASSEGTCGAASFAISGKPQAAPA